jgi:hypothetical protein
MANEVINLNTVFSGFNGGTDLQPKNTRTNNQGVTINDMAGFIKILSTAPASNVAGDMYLLGSVLKVCVVSGNPGSLLNFTPT